MRTGIIINLRHKEPAQFLDDCKTIFLRRCKSILKDHFVKVNAVFCGEFSVIKGETMVFDCKYINTKNAPIYQQTDLNEWYIHNIQSKILTGLEEFQERDSGWTITAIINLQININTYSPLQGSSFIELPHQIKIKNACVNVKNDDEACFAWAIIAALHPADRDPQRVNKYKLYQQELNLTGIQFPMTLKQIPRFETQNKISVNVYILEFKNGKFNVVPSFLTKTKQSTHVNLLMIHDFYDSIDDANEDINNCSPIKYHYVWIKNLSRLVSTQLSKHNGKKFICDRCLHFFVNEKKN